MPLDASTLVSRLLENQRLSSLLAVDPYGNQAIYQILSPEADVFPRIIVLEDDREYTRYADDVPLEERMPEPAAFICALAIMNAVRK